MGRLRAAPIFSQSVERAAKKKERAIIGDAVIFFSLHARRTAKKLELLVV